jgi:hypothetical protein
MRHPRQGNSFSIRAIPFPSVNSFSIGQSIGVQLFPQRRAESPQATLRRTMDRVMVLVSFATESPMDAVIFLTSPAQKT